MGLVIYRPSYQLCNSLCPVVPIAIEGFEMHRYMQEKAGETKGGKTAVVFQQRSGPQSQKDSLLLKVLLVLSGCMPQICMQCLSLRPPCMHPDV